MKVEILEVGKTFKNYKVLCEELEIKKHTNPEGRMYQMRNLERYCSFHKQGHKIIIDEVFNIPLPKKDGRKEGNNSIYNDYIQFLVLDLLAQTKEGTISISKSKLLRTIAMTNINYGYCSRNIPKLAVLKNITEEVIRDYFTQSNNTLNRAIETALRNLQDKKLIMLEKIVKVCQLNNETRQATEVEKLFILETEKSILKEMGYTKESVIREDGMYHIYKSKVDHIVCPELKIRFFYNAYDITINHKYIEEEFDDSFDILLEDNDRKEQKRKLNQTVKEQFLKNARNRSNGAVTNDKYFRKYDDYVDAIEELNGIVVDIDQPNIIDELVRIKVDKPVTELDFDDLF